MLTSFKKLFETDIVGMLTPRRQLVGLDIGSSAIKVAQLKESKGRYFLQKFGVKPLEPEVIVDGTVMDEGRVVSAIQELFKEVNVKNKHVAISISGHAVIVKKISLPPMPDEELEGQVKLAAEQYIPFDINEVNIDFHVLSLDASEDQQGDMSVILVAAKKDKINELTELVKAAGLVPMVMDVDAFAVENMHAINYPEGEKLFLKGTRCMTEKCAIERRSYPPGQHGQGRQRTSDYSLQLREKQKLRRIYGLQECQFRGVFERAERQTGVTGDALLRLLECRLDNVAYRLGFGASRKQARQMVSHGHFTINGKKITVAGALVKPGDVIEIRERSRDLAAFQAALESVDSRGIPDWLELDKGAFKGTVRTLPAKEQISLPVNEQMVVELYSR
ncbi:MAG: 30S ribosomal protein S4 [Nitrospira sp.]|nr:30S ribosomal protein S4 [Nitrospira sp.]